MEEREERYCSVKESLIESCKEVKLMREGKLPKHTWKELVAEVEQWKKELNAGNV